MGIKHDENKTLEIAESYANMVLAGYLIVRGFEPENIDGNRKCIQREAEKLEKMLSNEAIEKLTFNPRDYKKL